jgi:hypothetical protein
VTKLGITVSARTVSRFSADPSPEPIFELVRLIRYAPPAMINPRDAAYLPDHVWQALLEVTKHVDTLPIETFEKRILRNGIETLALKLAEASKRHNIRYPIGG